MEESTKKYSNRKPIILPEGGKEPVDRIMKAYGFRNRQALCDHLQVSKSTMANRIMRGNFPADWVIICAMETGVSLHWLTTGEGPIHMDAKLDTTSLPRKKLSNGNIIEDGYFIFDKRILPENMNYPFAVTLEDAVFVIETFDESQNIIDGMWLIEIDHVTIIRELVRLPSNRVRIEDKKHSFESTIDEIRVLGKVLCKTEKMV